jgi:hypothetical protein
MNNNNDMTQTNTEQSLNPCTVGNQGILNKDPVPPQCDDGQLTQKRVAKKPALDWRLQRKLAIEGVQYDGQSGNCDPIMTGQTTNDLDPPNREVIYRNSRAIRGCNEAMVDLFRGIKVFDVNNVPHAVPIIWGTQEKAVSAIIQENVRKDNSLVVERIRLPMLAMTSVGHSYDMNRYTYHMAYALENCLYGKIGFAAGEKTEKDTLFGVARGIPINISYKLYAWTLYQEDMDQIIEQVFSKFSNVAYLNIRGVPWEVIVKFNDAESNIDLEPGDKKQRIVKYVFNMITETYLPQPIRRIKGKELSDSELAEIVSLSKDLDS